jgi:hypothetical protein
LAIATFSPPRCECFCRRLTIPGHRFFCIAAPAGRNGGTDRTAFRGPRILPSPGVAAEGVILQTLAPPEAIMLIRKPEDYLRGKLTAEGTTWEPAFDESEVVVDPFRLGKIKVMERLGGKPG